jgi:hypothetical protein
LTKDTFNQIARHKLVRVRCMLQDIMDQEMFPALLKKGDKIQSLLYRDEFLAEDNMEDEETMEKPDDTLIADRNVVYCVPIPGETEWAKTVYNESVSQQNIQQQSTAEQQKHGKKRLRDREEEESDEMQDTDNNTTTTDTTQLEHVKRSRSDNQTIPTATSTTISADKNTLDFPIPTDTGLPFLVKMYNQLEDSVKLCDIVEVVGILSDNAALFSSEYQKQEEYVFFIFSTIIATNSLSQIEMISSHLIHLRV